MVGDTREGIKLVVSDDSSGVPGSQSRVSMTLTGAAPARLVIVNNNGLTTLNSTGTLPLSVCLPGACLGGLHGLKGDHCALSLMSLSSLCFMACDCREQTST